VVIGVCRLEISTAPPVYGIRSPRIATISARGTSHEYTGYEHNTNGERSPNGAKRVRLYAQSIQPREPTNNGRCTVGRLRPYRWRCCFDVKRTFSVTFSLCGQRLDNPVVGVPCISYVLTIPQDTKKNAVFRTISPPVGSRSDFPLSLKIGAFPRPVRGVRTCRPFVKKILRFRGYFERNGGRGLSTIPRRDYEAPALLLIIN